MFERLRQLFSRRKNKKSFTKKRYPSPPPSVYRKCFEFPPDPDQSFRTPKMAKICIEDSANLLNQFEISRIPTFQMRSSGWKSSKPYSQNATRFRFHGSYNR
uniref:Uncharacterized protein n=1 Tax=Panagrolaimus sp. PS1159 TaxID=55785 RepID=A0AC35FAW2_9BILA